MTWSALALFLARRTEFALSIGHFFIILPFHSPLATSQVCISLKFDLFFWNHCFGRNRSEVSVRVKINEYVHAWSEFLFVSLLLTFNFFPKINHFYYFTSLHDLYDVENYCAHLRDIELKTGRKIIYLRFPTYYALYNWIGEHEITKLKKVFASNPEKGQK